MIHPQPLRYSPVFSYKLGHADVCTFIKNALQSASGGGDLC